MDKEYHKNKSKQHYQKYRETYRAKDKRIRQRARLIMDSCKSNGCIRCGELEPCALDFHHLGNKDHTVARMSNFSEKRIREEIAKCVVLCSNCHRKLHNGIITI